MSRLKVILKRFIRFWDLRVGWFFINPHKLEQWEEKLRKKYGEF